MKPSEPLLGISNLGVLNRNFQQKLNIAEFAFMQHQKFPATSEIQKYSNMKSTAFQNSSMLTVATMVLCVQCNYTER